MWALGALLSKTRVALTWELQYYNNASDKLNGYQATNRQVAYAVYTPTEQVHGTEHSSRESTMGSQLKARTCMLLEFSI